MIRLKIRSHGVETAVREYSQPSEAVRSITTAGVDGAAAARIVQRDVFAYVGMHSTGQRFAVWRSIDKEAD